MFSNSLPFLTGDLLYVASMTTLPKKLIEGNLSSCGLNAIYRLYLRNIVKVKHLYIYLNIDIKREFFETYDLMYQVQLVSGRLLGNAQLNRMIVDSDIDIEKLSAKVMEKINVGTP